MAQKRLILVDVVPLSIKKSQVGTDGFPELVMFMTRNTEMICGYPGVHWMV